MRKTTETLLQRVRKEGLCVCEMKEKGVKLPSSFPQMSEAEVFTKKGS